MRLLLLLLCLLAGLMGGESPVFSDQEWAASQPVVAPSVAAETPGWGTVAGLGLGLLLVVALAIGLGYAAKRLNARRLLGGKGRNLELIETIQLAPRRQLALVRLGSQWLVVGLGEKEMSHIATMAAPPEAAPPAPVAPPPSAFAGELGRLLARPPEAAP